MSRGIIPFPVKNADIRDLLRTHPSRESVAEVYEEYAVNYIIMANRSYIKASRKFYRAKAKHLRTVATKLRKGLIP